MLSLVEFLFLHWQSHFRSSNPLVISKRSHPRYGAQAFYHVNISGQLEISFTALVIPDAKTARSLFQGSNLLSVDYWSWEVCYFLVELGHWRRALKWPNIIFVRSKTFDRIWARKGNLCYWIALTGPSLISPTSIIAWNTPSFTFSAEYSSCTLEKK